MQPKGFMKGAVCSAAILSLCFPLTSQEVLAGTIIQKEDSIRFSLESLTHSQLYSLSLSEAALKASGFTLPDAPLMASGSTINVSGSAIDVSGSAIIVDNVVSKENTTPKPSKTTKTKVKKENRLAISTAKSYVCIRKGPSTKSTLLGKLYRGSAGSIIKEQKNWVKVKSGSITGYVKKEFLATGERAEKLSKKYTEKKVIVRAERLNVRDEKSTVSEIVTQISEGRQYDVIREDKDWVKINVEDQTGFVSKDFVDVKSSLKKAISVKAEKEAKSKEVAARAIGNQKSGKQSSSYFSVKGAKTGLAASIVNYAMQFIGNPYVYGGTSLTNGIDCSAFTQTVMRKYGVKIPRTSREQACVGTKIDVRDAVAGDLIFYSNGSRINHVVLCIGNGKVISASSPKTGIRVCDIYYRTPVCARRVL